MPRKIDKMGSSRSREGRLVSIPLVYAVPTGKKDMTIKNKGWSGMFSTRMKFTETLYTLYYVFVD